MDSIEMIVGLVATCAVEGLLHSAHLVAVFGGSHKVHLFGGLLHLALGVTDLFS